jgi:outer membrane protein OmpA-like peptidoglycan-associated protein
MAQSVSVLDVEPYAGSQERVPDRVEEAFGEIQRITGFTDGNVLSEKLRGRVLLRRFANPEGRSTLEILVNYQQALAARGFVTEWECGSRGECGNLSSQGWQNGMNLGIGSDIRYLTGQMPYEGGTAYVSVGVEPRNHYVQILQTAALETDQVKVIDAAAMAKSIDTEGKIALDNIYFDFGSAVLLPSSDEALSEIAKLLAERPDLEIYVVGHTDSVGGLDSNLTLSRSRAQSVVDALSARFGVASGRAVPAGVGPLAPVASNLTDEGRALNRRVEIVAR